MIKRPLMNASIMHNDRGEDLKIHLFDSDFVGWNQKKIDSVQKKSTPPPSPRSVPFGFSKNLDPPTERNI